MELKFNSFQGLKNTVFACKKESFLGVVEQV
jgi:hypothetical protein